MQKKDLKFRKNIGVPAVKQIFYLYELGWSAALPPNTRQKKLILLDFKEFFFALLSKKSNIQSENQKKTKPEY